MGERTSVLLAVAAMKTLDGGDITKMRRVDYSNDFHVVQNYLEPLVFISPHVTSWATCLLP